MWQGFYFVFTIYDVIIIYCPHLIGAEWLNSLPKAAAILHDNLIITNIYIYKYFFYPFQYPKPEPKLHIHYSYFRNRPLKEILSAKILIP